MPNGWQQLPLASLLSSVIDYRGKAPPKSDQGVRLITARNVREGSLDFSYAEYIDENQYETWMNRGRPCEGDVLFTTEAPLGNACMFPAGGRYAVGQRIVTLRSDQTRCEPHFLLQYFLSDEGKEAINVRATGSTAKGIKSAELRKVIIPVPPLSEQRKIAQILRTWDEAIEKLESLRAAKEHTALAVQQRIFEQEFAPATGAVRARDLFEPVSERARPDLPLLAVMQDIGIVRRDELDRRVVMPDGDTSTYKVVRPGDFVISLRSFEGGLEYSNITGLVSPAYTVLRARTELVGAYYRHFFKSRSFIGRLDKLIFGIRDGKQIAFRDFGDMLIPLPAHDDQRKHAETLDLLERGLALETSRIEAMARQKRGLMQKLLTGEWRVKV